jgi:hypothetical protein
MASSLVLGTVRNRPLGLGGDRLFTWFGDGDVPDRLYPWTKMSAASAAAFDGYNKPC